MTRILSFLLVLSPVLTGCQKEMCADPSDIGRVNTSTVATFTNYTIKKGSQFCEQNSFRPVEISEMKFVVRFDSTAIYHTTDPANQDDINKLYGFSDNNSAHHLFSARIGWRWSNNALRLFGYVYNNGVMENKELKVIPIGEDIECGIKASAGHYIFTVNNVIDSLPRLSTSSLAKGYQLYPYFGGTENAPHDIFIKIKDK